MSGMPMSHRLIAALSGILGVHAGSTVAADVAEVATRAVQQPIPACERAFQDALDNGYVVIPVGETVCIDLEVKGTDVTPAKVTSKATAGRTLIIKAWREPGQPDTFMSVHNPTHAPLRYRAYISRAPGQLEYTSSCPVRSEFPTIEHWPYFIGIIAMNSFKLLTESDDMTCR